MPTGNVGIKAVVLNASLRITIRRYMRNVFAKSAKKKKSNEEIFSGLVSSRSSVLLQTADALILDAENVCEAKNSEKVKFVACCAGRNDGENLWRCCK